MKKIFGFLFGGLVVAVCAGPAEANFAITYTAPADPVSEGFTPIACCGPSTAGPIANDLGLPTWSIAGQTQAAQYGYQSGALSAAQKADVANQGFVLTLNARVLPGLAPAYDANNYAVIGGAGLARDTGRFDIWLGLNGEGDTVVVLPAYLDNWGNWNPGYLRAVGPNFTLNGSGSSYHNYQLVYDPNTLLANLFVDGIERIQGYAGYPQYPANYLFFAVGSGGQGNFNFVQLASPVPLPAAVWLFGSALAGLGVFGRLRAA